MNTKTNETRCINANALLEHVKDLPTWSDVEGMRDKPMKYPEGMFDCEDIINSIDNASTIDVTSKAELAAEMFKDIESIMHALTREYRVVADHQNADILSYATNILLDNLKKKYLEEKR